MTKTPILAFATSIAGSHYRDVGLIDGTSQPRPIVVLATSKVLMVQVGAKFIITYGLTQAVHIGSVNKICHASRHVDSP